MARAGERSSSRSSPSARCASRGVREQLAAARGHRGAPRAQRDELDGRERASSTRSSSDGARRLGETAAHARPHAKSASIVAVDAARAAQDALVRGARRVRRGSHGARRARRRSQGSPHARCRSARERSTQHEMALRERLAIEHEHLLDGRVARSSAASTCRASSATTTCARSPDDEHTRSASPSSRSLIDRMGPVNLDADARARGGREALRVLHRAEGRSRQGARRSRAAPSSR